MTTRQPTQPSDIYPPLTWPRLSRLAKTAFECRKYVYEHAEPERGDDVQEIGFRTWKHVCFTFTQMATNECRDWLSIKESAPHFTMKLKMMPIRFCRGDGDEDIPPNYTPDANEREQFEMALGSEAAPMVEGCFRLLIEHDHAGAPIAVRLALVDRTGSVSLSWKVPLDDEGSGASPIVVPRTPVTLPDLEVRTLVEAEAAEKKAAEVAAKEAAEQAAKRNNKKGA